MFKKVIFFIFSLFCLSGVFLATPKEVSAGLLSGISYGPSGSTVGTYVGASDTDFIKFTPLTAFLLDLGSTITVTFPEGTTLNSSNIATSDFRISQATQGLCITAGTDTAPSSISVSEANRTITFTTANGSLSKTVLSLSCGLGVMTVKTSSSASGDEIQHPTTATTAGTLQLDTSLLDSGSISTITFAPDSASKLGFTTEPSTNATAGSNLATQPVVKVQDQYGNTITSSSASVTLSAVLASDTNTSGGGTLSASTNPLSATSGVATFSGVDYTKAEDIKLKATTSGLTQALSNTISVSPATASQIVVSNQPSNSATAGSNFTTQPVLLIQDTYGNTVTSDNSTNITLSAVLSSDGTTVGSGTLNVTSGTLTAVNGVISLAGVNYTKSEEIKLKATASGLTQTLTDTVSVVASIASKLGMSIEPSTTATAGQNFSTQPVIRVLDAFDNLITDNSTSLTISAVLASDTSTSGGGTLSVTTNPVTAVNGVATFSGVSYTKAEDIKLKVTSSGLTQVLSNTISVSAAAASQLGISTQPSNSGTAGSTISTQPVILIQDTYLNTVVSDSSSQVTLSAVLASDGTTAGGGMLNADVTTASSGIVTFSNISYTKAESIKLKATAGGITQILSDTIVISPAAASQLLVSTQPSSTATAGTGFSTQPMILVKDAYLNTVTSDSSTQVTVSAVLASDTSTAGSGTLTADNLTIIASSGVVTFSGVKYTKAENIKLKVTAGGITQSFSNTIAVSAGAATDISSEDLSVEGSVTDEVSEFEIRIVDSYGNSVSGVSVDFNLSTPVGAIGHSLSVDSDITDANGLVSTILTLGDKAGLYEITATVSGLTDLVFEALAISAPTINQVTPSSVGQGAESYQLTVEGSYFNDDSEVSFSGSGITVNSVTVNSETEMAINISIDKGADTSSRNLTIENEDSGNITLLNALSVNTRPTVSSKSFDRLDRGIANHKITLSGSNFSSPSLDFGNNVSVLGLSSTSNSIIAYLSIPESADYRAGSLVVTNSDGGKADNEGFLIAPRLTISEIAAEVDGQRTATISWETSHKSSGVLFYGLSEKYAITLQSQDSGTKHSISLSNLPLSFVHHFKIIATDEYGQVQETEDFLFTSSVLGTIRYRTSRASNTIRRLTRVETVVEKVSENVVDDDQDNLAKFAFVAVSVVDRFGEPVYGARVELHSTPRITYTDDKGVAVFPAVEKGEHTIKVAHAGFWGERLWEVKAAETEGEKNSYETVVVQMDPRFLLSENWPILVVPAVIGVVGGFFGSLLFALIKKKRST